MPLAAVEKLNSNLVLFPGLNAVESVTSNTAESVDESYQYVPVAGSIDGAVAFASYVKALQLETIN